MISTDFIFGIAMLVFLLLAMGIFLTMREFERITDEPSLRKGAGSANTAVEQQDGQVSHG